MPFDPTGLNAILAGDTPAADAFHSNHPTGFNATIGAAVTRLDRNDQAASGTSLTIGTGAQVLTLTEARGYLQGTPVLIMEAGDPENKWMAGKLTVDESAGVITVNVTMVDGTGTYTSWVILALFAITTVSATPVVVADGGTGGTTAVTARGGLEVHRWLDIIGRQSVPPGGPSPGDAYIVLSGTGLWSGQDDDFATWDGASWNFATPLKGDSASIDSDLGIPGAGTSFIIFDGSEWIVCSNLEVADFNHDNNTRAITLAELIHTETFFYTYNGAAVADNTFTLPNGSGLHGKICSFKVDTRHAYDVILNVAGGETVDAAASLTLTPGDACRVIYSEEDTRWYLLSLYIA